MKIEKLKINTVVCGDSLAVLKTFPNESVDCVITSPPYFNLRDYGVNGQIGLEKTYQEYIDKLIAVFDEVKRILKKDGTCFINLMDTYGGSGGLGYKQSYSNVNQSTGGKENISLKSKLGIKTNYLQKSLMMIPERFGIAMIDRGWINRNCLIWIKPNAMPESVQDRWKKAHEYIFFFTKSKKYYFNLDAIRTPHKDISIKRADYEQGRNALGQNVSSMGDKSKKYGMSARQVKLNPKGAVPPDYLIVNTNCSEFDTVKEHYATYPTKLIVPLIKAGCPDKGIVLDPFFGSGTTGLVAKFLGRNYIGIELNPEYIKLAKQRLSQQILI
jgi:DNA modification methylase